MEGRLSMIQVTVYVTVPMAIVGLVVKVSYNCNWTVIWSTCKYADLCLLAQ